MDYDRLPFIVSESYEGGFVEGYSYRVKPRPWDVFGIEDEGTNVLYIIIQGYNTGYIAKSGIFIISHAFVLKCIQNIVAVRM